MTTSESSTEKATTRRLTGAGSPMASYSLASFCRWAGSEMSSAGLSYRGWFQGTFVVVMWPETRSSPASGMANSKLNCGPVKAVMCSSSAVGTSS